jgi:hypothetical protein
MDLNVLKAVDYVPEQVEVAKLQVFDIEIRPLSNLDSYYPDNDRNLRSENQLRIKLYIAPGKRLDKFQSCYRNDL